MPNADQQITEIGPMVQVVMKATPEPDGGWLIDAQILGTYEPSHVELTNILMGGSNLILEESAKRQ